MTDPKIVTDADTVARLAKAAKAIDKALGADQIVMITLDVEHPIAAVVAERDPDTGAWTAVAIETGDVWHYDPDTDTGTGTPAPAVAPVPVGVKSHDPDLCYPGRAWCGCECSTCGDYYGCICPDCAVHGTGRNVDG